jgi:hypothetical protein
MVDKDAREEALRSFDRHDTDKGGTISRREFNELLKSCGVLLTKRQLREVVDLLAQERSGSGHIQRDEFCDWWIAQGKHLVASADSRASFVDESTHDALVEAQGGVSMRSGQEETFKRMLDDAQRANTEMLEETAQLQAEGWVTKGRVTDGVSHKSSNAGALRCRPYEFRRDRSSGRGRKSNRKTNRIEAQLLATAHAHATEKREGRLNKRIATRTEELDRKLMAHHTSTRVHYPQAITPVESRAPVAADTAD